MRKTNCLENKEIMKMEYRILGKTGLRVSRVGLGGIPIQRIDAFMRGIGRMSGLSYILHCFPYKAVA